MILTRDDMSHYVRIGIAAKMLGVCTKTLRRWEQAEKLPCRRTVGGHRRIAVFEIQKLQGKTELERDKDMNEKTAIYARVSSHEQKKKGDLERQIKVAQTFCQQDNCPPKIFTDVASGLNTSRRGLINLCQAIEMGKINRVIVTYPDRLTRFGFRYLQEYFRSHGATISCLHQPANQSIHEEMVADLIAIVTSFSGRVHGLRSHKNTKKKNKAALF